MRLPLLFLLFSPLATAAAQKPKNTINVFAWNVQSEENDPKSIAEQLAGFKGYHLYCLSEVHPDSLKLYERAVGKSFKSANSQTGFNDRLQILFDSNRFKLLERKEHHEMNDRERKHRSPLALRLQDLRTKKQLIVMVNHLARGSEEVRNEQAKKMREWARDQNVAIINVGDFNYDYSFRRKRGNAAFNEMLRDNIWQWVKPKELVDTNWSDTDGDGRDNFPDSMLDFAFVSGPAKKWKAQCRVIVRKGDFPDGPKNSDHRPIEVQLVPTK